MLVEVIFKRAQPGLCYSDFVPHNGLFIGESTGKVISIDMPNSGAWNNFYRATTEPGLKHRWRHKKRLPYLDYLYLKRRRSFTIDSASGNSYLHVAGNSKSIIVCFFIQFSPQIQRHREDTGQDRYLIWPSMAIYMLLCFSVHKQCSVVKRPGSTPSFVWDINDSTCFVPAIFIAF